ncbi:unannotated protein [freshwater metagenome]|uniref:Unannotated protein n=1 Tax=freshwater metagenome TaxID=449393 RepID=A0A6J6E1Z1_9ZZZZ
MAYFFSLACRAGTTKRQICHSTTGSARMRPPYSEIRNRALKPSSGPSVKKSQLDTRSGRR